MQDTRKYVETLCNALDENLHHQYVTGSDQHKANLVGQYNSILENMTSADDHTSDAFKNILFAMYKKYVYYTWHVPIFTEENEYVMNALEHIIKKLYGEWFLEHHRLNDDHWIFAEGNYALCFTSHFIETVY